jgi:hypothetical protein
MDPSLQPVDGAADDFELRTIVRGECRFSLCLELTYSRFDATLIDADDSVMLVLNAKSVRDGYNQVFLIHLRVALYGVVLDACGHIAQFCKCLVS